MREKTVCANCGTDSDPLYDYFRRDDCICCECYLDYEAISISEWNRKQLEEIDEGW